MLARVQPTWLPLAIAAPLIAFALYRRVVGLTTRQEVRRGTMIGRAVMLCVVAAVLLGTSFSWLGLGAAALGAMIGVGLAMVSALRTTYEVTPEGVFYHPFRWIGFLVTGIFLARLAMRIYEVTTVGAGAAGHYGPGTLGIFYLLAGYYVSYFAFVLRRASALRA